jgi:hypothetical protein
LNRHHGLELILWHHKLRLKPPLVLKRA